MARGMLWDAQRANRMKPPASARMITPIGFTPTNQAQEREKKGGELHRITVLSEYFAPAALRRSTR